MLQQKSGIRTRVVMDFNPSSLDWLLANWASSLTFLSLSLFFCKVGLTSTPQSEVKSKREDIKRAGAGTKPSVTLVLFPVYPEGKCFSLNCALDVRQLFPLSAKREWPRVLYNVNFLLPTLFGTGAGNPG